MTAFRSEETMCTALKKALISDLYLQDISIEDIDDDAPLFGEGEGLNLDSLDAVEIVVLVEKHFGVHIASAEEGREAFASVNSLARYIAARQCQKS